MEANIKVLRKHRKFSVEFKRSIVEEYEKGTFSVCQLGNLHKIKPQVIYRWIYNFSSFNEKGYRMVENSNSSSKKLKDLEAKIKELERTVGQKQIKIDYLEKMIDIAKDDLNIDIKKNFNTQYSTGSGKTGKK